MVSVVVLDQQPHRSAISSNHSCARLRNCTRTLVPSKRGELEITDLNQLYLQEGSLRVALLGSDYHWFDCGTHASLNDAANLIRSLEEREGQTIACLEEIAWRKGYIDEKKARLLFASMKENEYSLGWERRFSSL